MVATNGLGTNSLADLITYISNNTTYIAVGTGTTPATASDTTLGTEVIRNARTDISTTSNSVTTSGYITSVQANGSTITEAGVFNDPTVGTMASRDTFTGIVKTSAIEIWIDETFTITITLNV